MAIDILASKLASITPNIAYVETGKTGRSVKCCERSLASLTGRGFGSRGTVGQTFDHSTGRVVDNPQWDYGTKWEPSAPVGVSGGGHSWLTVGEWRSKALSVVKPHEELEPLDSNHILHRLVNNPNPWDTGFAFRYERVMFGKLHGVDYVWEAPNDYGVPVERWVLPGHWVWPRTGGKVPDGGTGRRIREGGRLSSASYDPAQEVGDHVRWGSSYISPWHADAGKLIQYYEVRPWGGMGSAGILRLPPSEVTMRVTKSPLNKIDGYSKLSMIAQWIDEEEAISRSRWSQSMNIARPEFWVELGAGYEDPDDDRTARVEAKLMAKFQGEYNYGKPIIGPPGAKFNPLSFSPTEMAYFQSEEQIRDMILSCFHIPKSVAGISTDMTYGSLLATLAQMCAYALNPDLADYGECDTKHLASRWDEKYPSWSSNTSSGWGSSGGTRRVRLWYDDCVPADPAQVNSDIQTDAQCHAITPDEVRALRGRKPYPNGYGSVPWVQGPGGVAPYPLDDDVDMERLADLIKPMTEAATPRGLDAATDAQDQLGGPPESAEDGSLSGQPSSGPEGESEGEEAAGVTADAETPSSRLDDTDMADDAAGIESPNGKPSKGLVELAKAFLEARTKEQV